jgi:hypothetical protein
MDEIIFLTLLSIFKIIIVWIIGITILYLLWK